MPWIKVDDTDYFVNEKGEVRNPKGVISKPPGGRLGIYRNGRYEKFYRIEHYYRASTLGSGAVVDVILPRCLEGEEWKPSPRNERYYVSNRGRVYKARYVGKSGGIKGGLIVEPYIDEDGYVICELGKVHRLVYETFVAKIPKGHSVLHRNGVTVDNYPDNLKVGTPADNHEDRRAHLTQFIGETSPSSVMTMELARQIRAHPLYRGGYGSQRRLAKIFGVHPHNIHTIQSGAYSDRNLERMKRSLRNLIRRESRRGILPKECLVDYLRRLKTWGPITSAIRERVKSYVPKWKDVYASSGVELYMERRRQGVRRLHKRRLDLSVRRS